MPSTTFSSAPASAPKAENLAPTEVEQPKDELFYCTCTIA